MTIGTLILLGLITGEVVSLVKIGRQNERIKKLEKAAKQKKNRCIDFIVFDYWRNCANGEGTRAKKTSR